MMHAEQPRIVKHNEQFGAVSLICLSIRVAELKC